MIPDEAVEAAARVTFEGLFDLDPDDGWEHLTPADREPYERQVRAALEAAAPHMLSHEREQTRLAHDDAVVNAESLSRHEEAIQRLRDMADNAERDRDYVKVVDAAAIHAAIDEALRDPHTAKPNNWV